MTKIGSEIAKIPSEMTKIPSEIVKIGSEMIKIPSEIAKIGSEIVKISYKPTKPSNELSATPLIPSLAGTCRKPHKPKRYQSLRQEPSSPSHAPARMATVVLLISIAHPLAGLT